MKAPTTLSHYTTLDSFFNIINNCEKDILSFHGGDVSYMNDPLEYIGIQELLINSLKEYEKKNGLEEKSLSVANFHHPPFAISLSNLEDNLNMWRFYGDDGRGICIVLDFQILETSLAQPQPCIYYSKDNPVDFPHPKNIQQMYDDITLNADGSVTMGETACKIYDVLTYFAKSDIYQHEQEWRSCRICTPGLIKYKLANGFIKPYTIFSIPVTAIKKVIIGPCCHPRVTEHEIASLIYHNTNHYMAKQIFKSTLQYYSMR